jgi:hypothetical protein
MLVLAVVVLVLLLLLLLLLLSLLLLPLLLLLLCCDAGGNISRLSGAGTPTPSQPSSARRRSSRGADGHDGSANHSGGDANYFSSNLADRPFDSPNAAAVRSSLSTPHDAAEKYDYAEAVDDGTVTSVESELSGVCCSLAA